MKMSNSLICGRLSDRCSAAWAFAATIVLVATPLLCATAADTPESSQQIESSKTGSTNTTLAPNIKGHIEASTLTALTALKQAGRAMTKLKRASTSLYDEVTTRQVNIVDEPELIGDTVVSIPINFTQGELIPPRKKWVDYDMQEIGQLLALLQGDLDSVVIPAEKQSKASPIFGQISTTVEDVSLHYANLQTLTQLPDNNVQGIAGETAKIDDDMKQAEELRKKLFHIMKESA